MTFTRTEITKLPLEPGIYKYFDKEGTLLYIGKAKNLRKRVSSYFQKDHDNVKTKKLVTLIHTIEITPVKSEFEALLLEADLIHTYRPRYNVVWRDDKHYIYIKVTHEEFPRIIFARREDDTKATFFGPFPSSIIVKEVLSFLRRIIPYCTSKISKKACFYTHLGLCDPCPSEIKKMKGISYLAEKKNYRANIDRIKSILRGHTKRVEDYLLNQMKLYSEKQNYEEAAQLRNRLTELRYLTTEYQPSHVYIDNQYFLKDEWNAQKSELLSILKKYFTQLLDLKRIECFDISNISGTLATGSMVTFINGQADKNYYRHFKIRTVDKPNDFAMLTEVIKRRLKHVEWGFPDLFVIDGGKPQVATIGKVFDLVGIKAPYLGIAKQEEELVLPKEFGFLKIKLLNNSSGLHLIQRLRDEAHRFAHSYHEKLRLKRMVSM